LRYELLTLPRLSDTELTYRNRRVLQFPHPAYAWLGLRPAIAQHTADEHGAFTRCAEGRAVIVEIGVAEGVSALAFREAMALDGTLYLVDPFHLSRIQMLNFTKRTAHRLVSSSPRGKVVWRQQFSSEAVRNWKEPIDLLMIDGDHTESMVQKDWDDWSRFVVPGGLVAFHDARLFEGGWTSPSYGPVRVVDRLFRDGKNSAWEIVEEIDSLVVVKRNS
jgi:predicted O-methyltransferase YrrM